MHLGFKDYNLVMALVMNSRCTTRNAITIIENGLPPGIPTPGIPIPKIIGIPVVGIKGYRPGIPTIEYIEHRLISRWQHTCHIVSTPIIVGH